MKSRVHPKCKSKYRVSNWPEYEHGLVQRGDCTVWLSPEATALWKPQPNGTRGGQWKKESGYDRQGTVENAVFRYKSILGGGFEHDRLARKRPRR